MSQYNTGGSGSSPSIDRYPITPYTVGPSGKAAYQTIQAAVTAAGNAGGGGLVFIQPGSYAENVVFPNSIINLMGAGYQLTEIVGTMTPPLTTALQIFNLRLTADDKWIASNSSGTSVIEINNCAFTIINGLGIDLPNWTGNIFVNNCTTDSSVDDGFCNINSATIYVNNSTIGSGSNQITNVNGTMVANNSNFGSLININGTLQSIGNTYNRKVTLASAAAGYSISDSFLTGSAAALVQNSSGTFSLSSAIVNSSASPCITGAGSGVIEFTDISFINSNVVNPSLNATYGTNLTGNLNIKGGETISQNIITNGISPYALALTDEFLACDPTGGAITITLPASPSTTRIVQICDSTGQSATHNITINGNGNNITLNGVSAATFTISSAFQLVYLFFNGSIWNAFSGGNAVGSSISQITTDSGTVTPSGGNVSILGTADQISTSGSGSTETLAFPATGIRTFRKIVTVSGTSKTFALSDGNTWQDCTNGATVTLTVDTNANVAFPVGTEIEVFQDGAGQVVIAAGGGVTINSAFSNLKIASQYTGAVLKKTATDTWNLWGNLTA